MAPSFAALVTAQLQVCVSCRQGSLLPAMSREVTNLKSLKGPLFCQRAPKGSQFWSRQKPAFYVNFTDMIFTAGLLNVFLQSWS